MAEWILSSSTSICTPGNREAEKRKAELLGIANWIDQNDSQERDFYIVGDMNIQDAAELEAATPPGFVSLNDECRKTNTATGSDKPYDHVLYRPAEHPESNEVDEAFDFQVVNLIDAMRDSWRDASPYPGDPYSGNLFAQYYSDHHPCCSAWSSQAEMTIDFSKKNHSVVNDRAHKY